MTEQKMYTILTKKGMEAIAKAMAEDKTVNFTNMGVGDGGGVYPQIHENMTQLVNEKWRGKVTSVEVSNQNSKQVKVTALVPLEVGGFNVREVGIFNEVGDLMAIGTYPITWKPDSEDGALSELLIRMIIQVDNSDVVNVTVDDSVVSATKKDLAEHDIAIAVAERHGMRVKDGEFQYHDGSDWKTVSTDSGDLRDDGDSPLRMQVSETAPPVEDGRIYYNSFRKLFYVGRNGQWYQLGVEGDEKLDKDRPSSSPKLVKKTDTEVTLQVEQGMEYRYQGGNWQSSGVFINLARNTTYYFEQRYAEDDVYKASPPSEPLIVQTDKGVQQPPKPPTISDLEATSVTITGEPGTLVRLENTAYYPSPHTFTDLRPETRYYAYAKRQETLTHKESADSKSVNFVTPKDQWIYGFEIDEANSNPETAVRYIGDNAGFRPVNVNLITLQTDYGDWEDFIKENFIPVLVKDGKEVYELQHDDYTKKKDGSKSDLTGKDGDVFVKFPHVYRRIERVGNLKRVWLSDKDFDGAVSHTERLDNAYQLQSYISHSNLQDLYLLLFKNRASEKALGKGEALDGSKEVNTGHLNNTPFIYGSNGGGVKFLGLEDFIGNKLELLDGVFVHASKGLSVGYNNFNNDGHGYGLKAPFVKGGAVTTKTTSDTVPGYFTKEAQGGSNLNYTNKSDFFYIDKDEYDTLSPLFAGSTEVFVSDNVNGGTVFCYSTKFNHTFNKPWYTRGSLRSSSRLIYKNDSNIYYGAYLGSDINSVMRSVSGNTVVKAGLSIGIDYMRGLAVANNKGAK